MKKLEPLKVWVILLIVILLSGCSNNQKDNLESTNQVITPLVSATFQQNSVYLLDLCKFVDETKLQTIFSENPLFIKQENGGCRISNQWDTKAITISAFQNDQADKAIRWTTRQLITGWNQPVLIDEVNKVLLDGESLNLVDFQKSTLPLYEMIGFRSERILTVGDTAFWIIYPEAFTSIIDVIDMKRYIRISYFGFLPGEIFDTATNMAKELIQSLPEQFTVDYSFGSIDPIPEVTATVSTSENTPKISQLTVSSNKIYFGDLCEDEITTIKVVILSSDPNTNVFLVYRLISDAETNRNWITIKMDYVGDNEWIIDINAENDFNAYKLTNGALVEYGISVLYGIDGVLSSPFFNNISISQCLLK